ncbi:MAG TPA: phosphotransferase [Streptosporangiaceae bacterium]|nr:phosphotransferase [Streptosporangiaceae bacterium]
MPASLPSIVLDLLDVAPRRVRVLKDVPEENGSWLIELPGGELVVVRRYHGNATREELRYEHDVLWHMERAGWAVPAPVGELVRCEESWYCLTSYVPGQAVRDEDAGQQRRRGRDLAQLHLALRGLDGRLGQRTGWRAQHQGVTLDIDLDWQACVQSLAEVSPRLAAWADAAAGQTRAALAAIGAHELPVMVVHGDFAEWNVHYRHDRLAGVIDFGLTHVDSRPYELAIARTWRAPAMTNSYRAELARLDWPLSELEEAALRPLYHAFRLDQVAWPITYGQRTGQYDLAAIERHLARTGTNPP